jgi:regulator of nucleoside diphosphate kinase
MTRVDVDRLQRVIAARRGVYRHDDAHLAALAEEIERAEIVDEGEIPSDVVTMRSRVRVRDVANGEEAVYTLAFPNEADVSQGRLSVLAPIGTALLGYREGDVIEWPVPGGMRTLEVAEVLYQPEAAAMRAARGGQ